MAISEPTAVFSIHDDKDQEIKQVMMLVYSALEEKGYNPVNQLVGYILNIVAMIVVIILYCCHLDVLNYVLIFAGIEIYVFLIISGVLS